MRPSAHMNLLVYGLVNWSLNPFDHVRRTKDLQNLSLIPRIEAQLLGFPGMWLEVK